MLIHPFYLFFQILLVVFELCIQARFFTAKTSDAEARVSDRYGSEGLEILATGVRVRVAGFDDEEFFSVVAFGVDVVYADAHFVGWLGWLGWVLLGVWVEFETVGLKVVVGD